MATPLTDVNETLDARIAHNRQRMVVLTTCFGAAVTIFVALVLLLLGAGIFAPLVGLVVAGAWIAIAWIQGSEVVLNLADVDPADEEEDARLYNVTGGLCAAIGVSAPSLYVVQETALNAFATGRDPRHSSLVFTRGLLDELSLVELEAVVALLLHKIKCRDAAPETFVVPTVGMAGVLSELSDRVDWLSRIFGLPVPAIEKVIAWLHPSRGELDTDIAAVAATRYPPALASALEKADGRSAITVASPVTEHLWIAPPLALSSRRRVAQIHARLSDRISVLQEL